MTMVVWAACDNFALMMADREVHVGTATQDLSGLTRGADATKAALSADGQDIFGVGGVKGLEVLNGIVNARGGPDADRHLLQNRVDFMSDALNPSCLPYPTTVLHSYRIDGKIVCCRTEWTPTATGRGVVVAPPEKVVVTVAGSGGPYVQSLVQPEGALWTAMEKQVDDWRLVQTYFFRLFRVVTLLARGVGPDIDTWLLEKDKPAWRQLERMNVAQ